MTTYSFISGLPRSGSTLLSTILNQNPLFHASISGPLARFARDIVLESSSQGGYATQCDVDKRKRIIQAIFDAYYQGYSYDHARNLPKRVFDTNRGWTLMTPLLSQLYPHFKMIVCVRPINWILDSFETLVRKNALTATPMFSRDESTNVYSRCNTLMRNDRPLSFALEGLKQALTSAERGRIYVMEYEKLAKRPEQTLSEIYQFLDVPHFVHDFANVAASYDEFDSEVQLTGMHTTRAKVSFEERTPIIPPDLWQQYADMEFWRHMK